MWRPWFAVNSPWKKVFLQQYSNRQADFLMSLIIYKSNCLDHSAKLASFIKSWIASCVRCTPCRHCTVILTRINLHGDCSGIIGKANKTLTLNIYFRKRRKLQHAPTFFHWYTPLQKKKVQKLGSSVAHNLRSSIVFQLKVKNTTLIKSHRPTNKIEINITYAWRLDVIFDVYDQHIDDSVQDDTVKQCSVWRRPGISPFSTFLTSADGNRRHLRSAVSPTLVVRPTRRSTLGDRAFPMAAARA